MRVEMEARRPVKRFLQQPRLKAMAAWLMEAVEVVRWTIGKECGRESRYLLLLVTE